MTKTATETHSKMLAAYDKPFVAPVNSGKGRKGIWHPDEIKTLIATLYCAKNGFITLTTYMKKRLHDEGYIKVVKAEPETGKRQALEFTPKANALLKNATTRAKAEIAKLKAEGHRTLKHHLVEPKAVSAPPAKKAAAKKAA